MYLGTKLKFKTSFIPKDFKSKEVKTFSDYKSVEKKLITIKREDVIDKKESKTLLNIINKVNEALKTDKTDCFGEITFIEPNNKGANTLKDIELSFIVTVVIYYKPVQKPKKVLSKTDKAK